MRFSYQNGRILFVALILQSILVLECSCKMCPNHPPSISIFIFAPTFLTHAPETFDWENTCVDSIRKRKIFHFSYLNHKVCKFLVKKSVAEKLQIILFSLLASVQVSVSYSCEKGEGIDWQWLVHGNSDIALTKESCSPKESSAVIRHIFLIYSELQILGLNTLCLWISGYRHLKQ